MLLRLIIAYSAERSLSEHTPGGGTVQYAYDARDRLVLRTDPKMSPDPGSAGGKMVLTLHDQYDRVVEERYVSSPQASFETLRSTFRSTVTHTLSPSYITGILPTLKVLRTAEYFPYGSITYATSGDGAFIPDSGIVTDSDVEKQNIRGLLKRETVHPAPGPDGTVPAGAPSVTRYYHYDYMGRLVQVNEVWSDGHSRRLSTKYSFTGDVMATKETLSGPESTSITTTYTRDSRGRILSVSRNVGGTSMAPVTYGYDELGRLATKSFGSSASASGSMGYDIHGWTTNISATVNSSPAFSETLRYASAAKDQSAVRFDGNISEITAVHGTLSNDTYAYSYDGMKRLLGADRYIGSSSSGSLTRTEKNISYDRNGNITALKRYGDTGLDNDLSFTLTGNRMTGLYDGGTNTGTFSYAYDAMGNQTSDGRQGLLFSYNILNLPCEVTSATSGSLTYTYLSDGTKVSALKSDGSGKRYVGSMVYSVPASGNGSETLESAAWNEGRIGFTKSGSTYTLTDHWFVKDHLGNVRSVVDVSPGLSSPQVVERNDYLPYGTRLGVGNTVLATNRYRLACKEEQVFGGLDLGKVDFGARMYDPFTARWTAVDCLAALSENRSPYHFCSGNPIIMIDLTGLKDTTYVPSIDKGVLDLPNTATPLEINNIPNPDAYNCHSFAWESSLGDPEDKRNLQFVQRGITKWDENPDNNMSDFYQLSSNTPNVPGDRVLYYVDSNGNGAYDLGEEIIHSAVVYEVDKQGYTKTVISKRGQLGISINHPTAPTFYTHANGYILGPKTSRAYFRYQGEGQAPSIMIP